ncbi:hypothetical protein F5X98DRAFT_358732 [Xylaria grammica]|nr:hypothetical protein F5X98DRAFT_358732 [Xylaria grammica]
MASFWVFYYLLLVYYGTSGRLGSRIWGNMQVLVRQEAGIPKPRFYPESHPTRGLSSLPCPSSTMSSTMSLQTCVAPPFTGLSLDFPRRKGTALGCVWGPASASAVIRGKGFGIACESLQYWTMV